MSVVRTASEFPGTVHEAESCWLDTSSWPAWVNGLDHIVETSAGWPDTGAAVIWESGPAGRGRVVERVLTHEALEAITMQVDDASISGRQRVSFTPAADQVRVELRLEYAVKKRSIFTPLVDRLFIRRVMEASIATTLERFGAELAERRMRPEHH